MYFLIHCNADGEITVSQYTKDSLLKAIKDEDYDEEKPVSFFDKMPEESDPQHWDKALIIEGQIVSPRPVEVVKEYEI